jgi:hypothetical protein
MLSFSQAANDACLIAAVIAVDFFLVDQMVSASHALVAPSYSSLHAALHLTCGQCMDAPLSCLFSFLFVNAARPLLLFAISIACAQCASIVACAQCASIVACAQCASIVACVVCLALVLSLICIEASCFLRILRMGVSSIITPILLLCPEQLSTFVPVLKDTYCRDMI